MKQVTIYTDGACKGNPGYGGWGVLLIYGKHTKTLYGGASDTTNNRMELTAVIEALSALTQPCNVALHLDSMYVKNGITNWIKGWKQYNWTNSSGQVVKNIDLWAKLDKLVETSGHNIEWVWVRGHSGDLGNETADQLANRGAYEARGR